ncbi:VanZ family protein [Solobacterium moorei]|uniref:VanZ family protein n=1 Tax=Solobacterium moorei TaxID=102148 RepID=UPI0024AE252F|nr:VanZ family protein [Solobacterium moorei]MDI6414775.1 VanZ family protein [Solobacterium moorei]
MKFLGYKSVLLISLLLITSIELLQFVSHRGIFDVADILINTIGIMIGYIIFKTVHIKLH